jgi:hypothetical protein
MTGPGIRTKFVLAVLVVAALSGLATGSASASSTTAFTCAPVGAGGGFLDSHCTEKVTDGAHFIHSGFTSSTAITVSNAAPATFKANVAGVEISFVCTTVTGTGTIENFPGSLTIEMSAKGTAELTFSGCSFEQIPGCTISGGSFTTKPLSFGTGGLGMAVNVFPTTPALLAEVVVDGCSSPALNRTWLIEGSVLFAPHGTTLNSTHAEVTAQHTLTLDGFKAGLSSSFIVEGPSGSGIAFTT